MQISETSKDRPPPHEPFVLKNGDAELGELPRECVDILFAEIVPLFLARIRFSGAKVYVMQTAVSKLNPASGVLPGAVSPLYFQAAFCFGKTGPSIALKFVRDPKAPPLGSLWTEAAIRDAAAWIKTAHANLFEWGAGKGAFSAGSVSGTAESASPPFKRKRHSIAHEALLIAHEKFGASLFTRADLQQHLREAKIPNPTGIITETLRQGTILVVEKRGRSKPEHVTLRIAPEGFRRLKK